MINRLFGALQDIRVRDGRNKRAGNIVDVMYPWLIEILRAMMRIKTQMRIDFYLRECFSRRPRVHSIDELELAELESIHIAYIYHTNSECRINKMYWLGQEIVTILHWS